MNNENKTSTRGGKREGSGRKMLYEGGRKQLAISCSEQQKQNIIEKAKKQGLTTAQYVLQMCGEL